MPPGALLEGLIIDDYVVIWIAEERSLQGQTGPDTDLMRAAEHAYERAHLQESVEKRVARSRKFTAWGTEVCGHSGIARTPLAKLIDLFALGMHFVLLPYVTKSLIRRVVALFNHPFSHRRILNSNFHRVYQWLNQLTDKDLSLIHISEPTRP